MYVIVINLIAPTYIITSHKLYMDKLLMIYEAILCLSDVNYIIFFNKQEVTNA